jgi:hypothetical protein
MKSLIVLPSPKAALEHEIWQPSHTDLGVQELSAQPRSTAGCKNVVEMKQMRVLINVLWSGHDIQDGSIIYIVW